MKQINVLVGPNGSGKSNLYRSLFLIAAAASGQFARELANEGGMESVLWAGNRHKSEEPKIRLKVEFDELQYEMLFGRIPFSEVFTEEMKCFANDPDIKEEQVRINYRGKSNVIVNRTRGLISAKNMDGRQVEYPLAVTQRESILSGLRDPQKFPELGSLREEFLNWRFYHQFRTDSESPLRQPQLGVMTPVLAHDGIDLAAALQTIRIIGEPDLLDSLISEAFPGARLVVGVEDYHFSLSMHMPGFNRAFESFELSDGTLQYLCLLGALLTPRPPTLMALNEPETSIHPDLFECLAKLIARASKNTQILVTTHSHDLATSIKKYGDGKLLELEKVEGETRIKSAKLVDDDE